MVVKKETTKQIIQRLVSEGKTTKQISELTGFTVSKIRYHRENKKKYKQAEYRQKRKKKLVEMFGGKCQVCGYDKYIGNLVFHHKNPKTKEFGIADGGMTFSLDRLIKEAKKCILLCHNCHGEVHAGLPIIPV